jgi:SAM-dependent methyltransferase
MLERQRERLIHHRRSLTIALPDPERPLAQDEEWVVVKVAEGWRQVGMHDYAELYSVPGLYERVVYDALKCRSPQRVRQLLRQELQRDHVDPSSLTFLDLGAGNGYVAQELAEVGVRRIVGVDILPEAAEAAERDRPGLYEDYVVGDLTDLDPQDEARLQGRRFDGMTCVAALGFGDIPPAVFAYAYGMLRIGGWVAFTIKSDFLEGGDRSGFADLIGAMLTGGSVRPLAQVEYPHRMGVDRQPISYTAFVCRKESELAG